MRDYKISHDTHERNLASSLLVTEVHVCGELSLLLFHDLWHIGSNNTDTTFLDRFVRLVSCHAHHAVAGL